jgi:6-phosphogluconolactonase
LTSRICRSAAAALLLPLLVLSVAGPVSAEGTDNHVDGNVMIYTETNAPAGNEIIAFQKGGGSLTQLGKYATGGTGSGLGLGSQGAVVIDDGHLLAVNAGSSQVSLLSIQDDGSLHLADIEPSGGTNPVSLAVRDDLVYVVNAGSNTVAGFHIHDNQLEAIKGSGQSIPGNGAAQISFDNTGRRLIVTLKATNTIDVLPVNRNGVAGAAVSNPSSGQTPFGFNIDSRNTLVVSNAAGGGPGASSVSSYRFDGPTGLRTVSSAVADTQSAACWIEFSANERFAFTTNTGSGTISSYRLARDGSLTLAEAVAATPGAGPIDMIQADGSLFTLNGRATTISAHNIGRDGALTTMGHVSVPAGVVGLAASNTDH